MRIVEIRRVIGVWEGNFEPAVSVDLERATHGRRANWPKGFGEITQDALYLLRGVTDRRRAAEAMRRYSFPGGRFDGNRLEIADKGSTRLEEAVALAAELGARFESRAGHVEFLAEGDWQWQTRGR